MSGYKVLPIVSIFFVSYLVACKNGGQEHAKLLLGKWDILYSEMNGQPNAFMTKAYMNFEGKKVKTNIFGEEGDYPFVFDGTTLSIDGSEKLEMEVTRHMDDSISIRGQVRTFDMKFGLKKSK